MRSFQHLVELRRLDPHLPVLGKANSLCKIVKMLCVLTKSAPRRARDKDIAGYCSSGKIRVLYRRCTVSVALFRSLMLTPMR